ncbi:MAG: hypothetical protein SVP26_09840 [Chloroflexota bacterium]|nr:hypothetical protein [Chloroflexota bacterium]
MAVAMFPALAVIGFIVGTMFWAIMSERIGVTKPIYLVCMVLTGVCGVIVFYTAPSVTAYLLAFFPGFFIGAGPAIVMMQPLRLPEFGPRYAANATGVLTAIHHVGGFIFLPYFFTPLWHSAGGLAAALIVWLGSMTVSGLLVLGIPETGRKARERMGAEAASHEA